MCSFSKEQLASKEITPFRSIKHPATAAPTANPAAVLLPHQVEEAPPTAMGNSPLLTSEPHMLHTEATRQHTPFLASSTTCPGPKAETLPVFQREGSQAHSYQHKERVCHMTRARG